MTWISTIIPNLYQLSLNLMVMILLHTCYVHTYDINSCCESPLVIINDLIVSNRKAVRGKEMRHNEVPQRGLFPLGSVPAPPVGGFICLAKRELLRQTSPSGEHRSFFIGQFSSPRFGPSRGNYWCVHLSSHCQFSCKPQCPSQYSSFSRTQPYSHFVCDVIEEAYDKVRTHRSWWRH